MSASYFMLRITRRKRRRQALEKTKQDGMGHFTNIQNNVHLTSLNNQCRVCLNIGSIPLYNRVYSFDIVEAIQTFGGIKISKNDDFPKHLCEHCYSLLQGAVLFRKFALQSEEILRRVSCTKSEATNETDVLIDDGFSDIYDKNDLQSNIGKSKQFKCKTCKISFKSWNDYVIHKNSQQHRKVRIQCPICHRLLTVSLYNRHIARHESASHLVCEVCGKLYRKDNLIRHLQLHSCELPFQCQVCPYRGRFLESLKIHIRTHTGDKPFSCDKCNLRYLTRSNLNRHLLTHKQEKAFKCVECSRSFHLKRDMEVHFRTDHAGIKDFGCGLCGNKYGTRKALYRHELRVHKRVKMAKGRMPLYLQAEYRTC